MSDESPDLERPVPRAWQLSLAVGFPACVILFEAVMGLCANTLFDPLPTIVHLLLVAAVPLVNFLLWWNLWRKRAGPRWLAFAAGAAIAVSASYVLLFAPIYPISVVAIIFYGMGLLPFAPLFTLFFAIRWDMRFAGRRPHLLRDTAIGGVLGLGLLAAADVPATAAFVAVDQYGASESAERDAIRLMRAVGDEHVLLRLAYGDTARATGLISYLVSAWGRSFVRFEGDRTAAARELYFRATGTPFNAMAAPTGDHNARRWLSEWDGDQGGETVGRRVEGLALATSRIDGSVAPADNLGYFEWTMEVKNQAELVHEARLTLALPEGAVASRATLWVNGEPREAAVAGRGAARAAYESVVRAQRDPLLVTTDGAQRLLVQAFPIPSGGSIKFRVGYTAPFAVAQDGSRSLALPAIVERNFDVAPEFAHHVWVAGDGRLGGMLRGALPDQQLLAKRPRITADRLGGPLTSAGMVPAQDKAPAIAVTQTVAPACAARPSALALVIDGSASNRAAAQALRPALDTLPAGLPVGLWIAGDASVAIAPRPWSPEQRTRMLRAIDDTSFAGGHDNLAQLAAAAAAVPSGTLVWIHGPQPVAFARSRARLDQLLERSPRLPTMIRYQPEPGRAFTIDASRWFNGAREVTPSGDVAADLAVLLRQASGAAPAWAATRVEGGAGQGSAHLVRLWAAEQILAAPGATPAERDQRLALARRLNLITPISGAVVLETKRDYVANDLPVPGAGDVPTVPEPETWALLAILLCVAAWLLRRARFGVGLRPSFA